MTTTTDTRKRRDLHSNCGACEGHLSSNPPCDDCPLYGRNVQPMTTTTDTCGYGCNDFNLEPHEMCAMCRNRLPTMTTTDTRTNLINSLESALQDEWCTLTTRSTNYAARVVIQGRIAKLRARLVAACKAQHAAPIAPRGEDYKCVGICDALPLDDATFIYEPSYNIIMDCDRYEAQTRISKAQHSTPITPRGEDYQLMCEFEPSWWVADPPDCTRARIGEDCRQYELHAKAQPITPRGEDYEIGVTGETLLGGCYTPVGSLTLAAAIASDCINHESRSMWGHAVG